MHVHHVPHAKYVESLIGQKRGWDDTVLSSAYPIHMSASEVNHSGATCKSSPITVIFLSSFVEQLTIFYFWTCSGIVFYPSSPLHRIGIMSVTCQKVYVNPYISIVNLLWTCIHTYIQAQPQDWDPTSGRCACTIMSLTLRCLATMECASALLL